MQKVSSKLCCPYCGKEYKSQGWLEKHVHDVHKTLFLELTEEEKGTCRYCGKPLLNPENPMGCNWCGEWVGPARIPILYEQEKKKRAQEKESKKKGKK